jgi:hypothetical protein
MAIDFAKGIATQVVNTGLRKVAGNLPGLLGINKGKTGRDSSDTAPLNQKGKANPNLFQFPLDVAGDPGIGNHGHYMLFFINEQKNQKLSFTGKAKDGKESIVKEKARRKIPDYIKKNFGGKDGYQKTKNTGGEDSIISSGIERGNSRGIENMDYNASQGIKTTTKKEEKPEVEGGLNVSIKRPATRRLDTAIAMYMPNAVQVTYATNYNEDQISSLVSAAASAYQGVKSGGGIVDAILGAVPQVKDQMGKRLLTGAAQTADALGITGGRTAIEIVTGEIIADRMELSFKGVGRRAFQYTFKMIPKNSREADEIRKIVFAFKANMLPEFSKGRSRDTMSIPNTFNIQYMYKQKENDYIHRVSECFLENVQVSYGGDRYKTFEPHADDGAPPVETTMTLAFKEIEVMSRERIFEGY